MNRRDRLHDALVAALAPAALEVHDESHGHSVPRGSESHFKIVIVSDRFEGLSLVARHRLVNETVAAEFQHGLHALAIHAYTPEQWQARGQSFPSSPPCRGGSKADIVRS